VVSEDFDEKISGTCVLEHSIGKNRLQSSSKVLLKGKGKRRHCRRQSSGLQPDGIGASIFVQKAIYRFKQQEKNLGNLFRS
jgi:hypothetical protein